MIVPEADRIGKEGEGWKIMMAGLNFERTNIAAGTVGWIRLVLNQCVPYAQRRVQFGKTTADMPSNQDKIANIVMRLNFLRNSVYYTALQWDQGEDITVEASSVKCMGVEMALKSAEEATQIHGRRRRKPLFIRYRISSRSPRRSMWRAERWKPAG